jgi:adenine phosphoribosyltransferase
MVAQITVKKLDFDSVKQLVRDIPDFPKKGILFKDITPALAHPGALAWICDELAKPFVDLNVSKVLAIESRGFFFGTGIAERLRAGLVPVRKAGKLPWETVQESYALEYGEATLEIHRDALSRGERVLLVDDVLATGGTLQASRTLAERLGGVVVGAACFLEIEFLKGRERIAPIEMHSIWRV